MSGHVGRTFPISPFAISEALESSDGVVSAMPISPIGMSEALESSHVDRTEALESS